MVPTAHPSPQPKRHLDRFSGFCRAHDRDRQTDRPRYSVCKLTIGRIYVCILRCGPIIIKHLSSATRSVDAETLMQECTKSYTYNRKRPSVCHGSARLIWAPLRLAARSLRVATLATVGSGRGSLGAIVARQAPGSNGRCVSTGGFLTLKFKLRSRFARL